MPILDSCPSGHGRRPATKARGTVRKFPCRRRIAGLQPAGSGSRTAGRYGFRCNGKRASDPDTRQSHTPRRATDSGMEKPAQGQSVRFPASFPQTDLGPWSRRCGSIIIHGQSVNGDSTLPRHRE